MTINDMMKEASLEIDDVRWYLSVETAKKLIKLKENPKDLVNYIHSKEMESDLYDIEQLFLDDLQKELDNKSIDEVHAREILYKINRERVKRRDGRTNIEKSKKD